MSLRLLLAVLLLVPVASGCDTADPEDNVPSIAGTWSGVAQLPNGFTASMTLQQTGPLVNGTARIAGSFIDAPIEGEVNIANRFVWTIQRGCEMWSGSLAIDEASGEMNGSINLSGGSCPSPRSATGTLRLSRS